MNTSRATHGLHHVLWVLLADELEAKLQAADVGEAEDVAAMVSLMSRRDAHVEQELQRTTAYHAKVCANQGTQPVMHAFG